MAGSPPGRTVSPAGVGDQLVISRMSFMVRSLLWGRRWAAQRALLLKIV